MSDVKQERYYHMENSWTLHKASFQFHLSDKEYAGLHNNTNETSHERGAQPFTV